MKSVLLSIRQKWCELIAKGEKTIEIRKTRPKMEPPFKVYIYMTAGDAVYNVTINGAPYTCSNVGGKCVIGEFVCDAIISNCEMANADIAEQQGCIKREHLLKYANGKELYGWHISDLVIYDKPKELSKFHVPGYSAMKDMDFVFSGDEKYWQIKKPPQSWCYVEEK